MFKIRIHSQKWNTILFIAICIHTKKKEVTFKHFKPALNVKIFLSFGLLLQSCTIKILIDHYTMYIKSFELKWNKYVILNIILRLESFYNIIETIN